MPATSALARGVGGGGAHIGGSGGHTGVGGHAGAHFGPRFPQTPATPNRVPTPLPSPPQAPVINGPLSPSGLPAMGGGI
jgi:hypothetical protein